MNTIKSFLLGLVGAFALAATVSAQTVYIPSGTSGIGSSANSNVGIGTSSSPGYKLEVAGSLGVGGNLTLTASNSQIGFTRNDGAANVGGIGWHTDGVYYLGGHPSYGIVAGSDVRVRGFSSSLRLGTNGADVINIDSSGNVGIGTSSPGKKLDVAGTIRAYSDIFNGQIAFGSGDATLINAGQAADSSAHLSFSLWNSSSYNPVLYMKGSGNVGIGTTSPAAKLDVRDANGGYFAFNPLDGSMEVASGNDGTSFIDFKGSSNLGSDYRGRLMYADGSGMYFVVAGGTTAMRIDESGNVGIGTTSPTQKLAVNGTIRAKEVIVDTGWSDYVFAEDYRLASLSEVERHIRAEKHLPGIPSAAEVAEHGVSMGDMQSKLLAKVEELTLHLIAQDKRAVAQEKEIAVLRGQLAELRALSQ